LNYWVQIIQQLVRTRKVHSQEELAALLADQGIQTTQATLSRDLRKLHITKQHDEAGGYYYVLPGQSVQNRAGESIVSLEVSGQMAVIKTLPGCANMVGALIDEHEHPTLMGSIAGDDTLMLVLRENASRTEFLAFLESFIPGAGSKLIQNNPLK
jgi:transcriptional regulator of arginine metabolism